MAGATGKAAAQEHAIRDHRTRRPGRRLFILVEHAIEGASPGRAQPETPMTKRIKTQAASEGITSVTRRDFLMAARPPRRL